MASLCTILCFFLGLLSCSPLLTTVAYSGDATSGKTSQENLQDKGLGAENEKTPAPVEQQKQNTKVPSAPQKNLAKKQTAQPRREAAWHRQRTGQPRKPSTKARRLPSRKYSILAASAVTVTLLIFYVILGNTAESRKRRGTFETPELFVPLEILTDIPLPFMAEEDNTLQIVTGASATKSLSEAAHSPLIKWEWTSVNLSIPGLPTRPLRSAERVGLDTRVVPSPAVPGAFHIPPKADLEKNVVVAYHPQVHNKNVSYRIETKPLHATYRNLAVKHHQALRMGADFVAKMNVKGFWFPPPPEGVSPAPLVHLIDEKMTAFDLAPGASDILTQRNENLQVQATAAFMSQMTAWSLGRWLMTRKHSP